VSGRRCRIEVSGRRCRIEVSGRRKWSDNE